MPAKIAVRSRLADLDAGGQRRLAGDLGHQRAHHGLRRIRDEAGGEQAIVAGPPGSSCPCVFHSNRSPRSPKIRTCRAITSSSRLAGEPTRAAVLDEAAVRPAGDPHDRAVPLGLHARRHRGHGVAELVVGGEEAAGVDHGAGSVSLSARGPAPEPVAWPLSRARSSVASDQVRRARTVR